VPCRPPSPPAGAWPRAWATRNCQGRGGEKGEGEWEKGVYGSEVQEWSESVGRAADFGLAALCSFEHKNRYKHIPVLL